MTRSTFSRLRRSFLPTANSRLARYGRLLAVVLSLGLAGSLAACAPGKDLPVLAAYTPHSYQLGAGDQIRIIVFGQDQLTGEFRVDDQGRVAIPLLGNVEAAALTPHALGEKIAADLKSRDLLRDPSVSVEVMSYRPVFVLGEVARPGQYPYQPGMTVLTAVAVAGGYTYRAYQHDVSVTRTTGDKAEEGRAAPNAFVAPGDVIKVFERRF